MLMFLIHTGQTSLQTVATCWVLPRLRSCHVVDSSGHNVAPLQCEFLPHDEQSTVLRSHVIRLSVCDAGGL